MVIIPAGMIFLEASALADERIVLVEDNEEPGTEDSDRILLLGLGASDEDAAVLGDEEGRSAGQDGACRGRQVDLWK